MAFRPRVTLPVARFLFPFSANRQLLLEVLSAVSYFHLGPNSELPSDFARHFLAPLVHLPSFVLSRMPSTP